MDRTQTLLNLIRSFSQRLESINLSKGLQPIDSYIAQQHTNWRSLGKQDDFLAKTAGILLILAILLMTVADNQVGFLTGQQLSPHLLPDSLWAQITFCGDTVTALSIALLFYFRFPQMAMAILMAALAGTLLIHGCKHLLSVARPPAVLSAELINVIGPAYKSNSLPSGHTATAFILAGVLSRCCQQWRHKIILLFAAALVGYSRVACGVHWPVDVLAGAAIGLLAAWFGLRMSDRKNLSGYQYLLLSLVHAGCALSLIRDYRGGFANTEYLAQSLGLISIGLWLGSWLLFFYGKALYQRLKQVAFS